MEEGISKLLAKHGSQAAGSEAASLKQFKQRLHKVEGDIRHDQEQLGGEQADLMAQTVRTAISCCLNANLPAMWSPKVVLT